jgi:thioesterase domain-containing protein
VSAAAFLSELRRLDIRVWADGDTLRCNAPAGTLSDELREQLRRRRDDLLNFLRMAETAAVQPRAIVPLQPHGSKVPVFAVPGHNGDVFCYRALAQALGKEQPFFGLQPPGLDGDSEPLRRVEDLAAYFAEQIRAFRPRGPLIVAGFCAGGSLAFELAQQLARGDRGGFLALFGAPYPSFFRTLGQLGYRMERRARLLAEKSGRERLRYVMEKFRRRPAPQENPALDAVMALRAKVEQATLAAVRAYYPRSYPGRVHLFIPSKAWASWSVAPERWRSVARQAETYFGPDGCSNDNMLLSQNAPAFAELFRDSCELKPSREFGVQLNSKRARFSSQYFTSLLSTRRS